MAFVSFRHFSCLLGALSITSTSAIVSTAPTATVEVTIPTVSFHPDPEKNPYFPEAFDIQIPAPHGSADVVFLRISAIKARGIKWHVKEAFGNFDFAVDYGTKWTHPAKFTVVENDSSSSSGVTKLRAELTVQEKLPCENLRDIFSGVFRGKRFPGSGILTPRRCPLVDHRLPIRITFSTTKDEKRGKGFFDTLDVAVEVDLEASKEKPSVAWAQSGRTK